MRIYRKKTAYRAERRRNALRSLKTVDECGTGPAAPGKKRSKVINWNMVSSLISVLMAVITLLTLFEMKADRTAAYRPDISFADALIAVAWDENGLAAAPDKDITAQILRYTGSESLINADVPLKVYNIGVGTAKDIALSWDQAENLAAFASCFDDCGGIEIDTCPTCAEVFGTVHGFPPDIIRYDFMLNSAETYNTVYFPQLYLDFLTLYAGQAGVTDSYPTLTLTADYYDVQGTRYSQKITVSFELIAGSWGRGNYCVFNMHFTEV